MNNSIHRVWLNPAFRASMVPCLKNVALIAAAVTLLGACVGRSDMDLPPIDLLDASLTDTPADSRLDSRADTQKDTQTDTPVDGKPRSCSPETCNGCCDEDDDCRVGGADRACGRGGVQCTNCELSDTICDWNAGACVDVDPPICNAATCKGCCDEHGNCHTKLSATHCGFPGELCMDCSALQLQCDVSTGRCVSEPEPKCSTDNCDGCCDWNNNCVEGTSSTACGSNGKLCIDCKSVSAMCDSKSRLCQHLPDPSCNPSNCKGCCDTFGKCHWMLTNERCGINASACINCQWMDAYCDVSDGQCLPNTCGPANCDGCCDDDGKCVKGFSNDACGADGQKCVKCSPSFPCNPAERKCMPRDDCGPDNCPGCCTLSNSCIHPSMITDYSCGLNGVKCVNCTAINQYCLKATGQCTSTPSCGPHNCKGCCDGTTCRSGTGDSACGNNGQTCVNCTVNNQTCSKATGQCTSTPSCGPHNCKGCCDGATCRSGTGDSACGNNGQTCVNCTASSKTCSPTSQSCVSATSCGEMSCQGCCNAADGLCHPGKSQSSCGERAEVCQDCATDKGVCVAGTFGGGICIAPGTSQTCNADTCRGCCECISADNCACREGTKPQMCGHDGRICQTCNMNASVSCVPMFAGGGRCTYVGAP